ncbi:hypothetical protein PVAND_001414 [Polypedilum vanderplanki]|uniref:Uncharacterized protein n=1 Tax=Polypedilum vanderplanki TaxID=319348 RepID=A0A9J6BND0_POLVA|nr:hypothetical protein PVAND_001414 [Polypedilum vanderplanki]
MNKFIFLTFILFVQYSNYAQSKPFFNILFSSNVTATATTEKPQDVYDFIKKHFDREYPNDPKFVNCIIANLRKNNYAQEVSIFKILLDTNQFFQTKQPYFERAKESCTPFHETEFGIGVIIFLICFGIAYVTAFAYCFAKKCKK